MSKSFFYYVSVNEQIQRQIIFVATHYIRIYPGFIDDE